MSNEDVLGATPDEDPTGQSRRDVLKKGAIVGGLVWAAPAITTLERAAAGSHPVCPCEGRGTGLYATGATEIIPQGQSSGAEVCEASVSYAGVNAEAVCGSFSGCTANAGVASFSLPDAVGLSGTAITSSATQAKNGDSCRSTGTAGVASLTFQGTPVNVAPGQCNRVITLSEYVTVIYNEQVCNPDGTFTVTALHIIVKDLMGNPVTNLRIAESRVRNGCCAGHCVPCQA